jgi:hypothetical protein
MHARELTDFIVSLVSTAGFFALAVLSASRGKRDPLAGLLAVLCLDLVVYGMSELVKDIHPPPEENVFDWINAATASVAPALFYHLVTAFVGRRKSLQRAILASYMFFGAFALLCLTPLVLRSMGGFVNGPVWASGMLIGMAVVVAHGTALLMQHIRERASCSRPCSSRRSPTRATSPSSRARRGRRTSARPASP